MKFFPDFFGVNGAGVLPVLRVRASVFVLRLALKPLRWIISDVAEKENDAFSGGEHEASHGT